MNGVLVEVTVRTSGENEELEKHNGRVLEVSRVPSVGEMIRFEYGNFQVAQVTHIASFVGEAISSVAAHIVVFLAD